MRYREVLYILVGALIGAMLGSVITLLLMGLKWGTEHTSPAEAIDCNYYARPAR